MSPDDFADRGPNVGAGKFPATAGRWCLSEYKNPKGVRKMMNFALKMMNSALKMRDLVLKMTVSPPIPLTFRQIFVRTSGDSSSRF